MKVYIVRMGKEAVGVWKEYFEELLNGREKGDEEVHGGRERFDNKGNGLLGEDITREDVVWALCELKVKDGITVEMMNREVLVELWWELFSWWCLVEWSHLCREVWWWQFQKKRNKGVCSKDDF